MQLHTTCIIWLSYIQIIWLHHATGPSAVLYRLPLVSCLYAGTTHNFGWLHEWCSFVQYISFRFVTNICSQSTAIPVSACPNGLCKHLLHVPSSHCNPSTTNITVTVTTMSLLGTRTSDPVTIGNKYYSYVCYRSNCMMAPQLFIRP